MSRSHAVSEGRQLVCWLIDTRNLWPGSSIDIAEGAEDAMSFISTAERKGILGRFFIKDARMSLASALLKRAFVCYALGVSWPEARIGRRGDPVHGKPCVVDALGAPVDGIDFNVSHSGGLVTLIGSCRGRQQSLDGNLNAENGTSSVLADKPSTDLQVGVDIVCVNEQDHFRSIETEGFDTWIDMYEDVFSSSDLWSLKYEIDWFRLEDGTILTLNDVGGWKRCIDLNKRINLNTPGGRQVEFSSRRMVEAKLRRFHAYFCFKEAWIKLTGEALLAPWIKELQVSNVRSPKPVKDGSWGENIDGVDVHLQGRTVKNARMRIQAFEEHFMIASAVQGEMKAVNLPEFTMLDLEKDVLAFAKR